MKKTQMTLAVAAALLSLSSAAPAHAQSASLSWHLTPTPTETARFRGLSAVNDATAWAAGTEGTVLRTTNGGGSWHSVGPDGVGDLQFRDIEAFSADEAVVMSIGEGESSRIYRTADGGQSWAEVFRNRDERAFYDCIAFGDASHGLAVSDPVDGRFRFVATFDGGKSWSTVDPAGIPDALPGEAAFAASGTCLVARGDNYWLATGGGAAARVYHSADGGKSWTVAETPVRSSQSAGVFALAFRDDLNGIAIGGDYADPTRTGQSLAFTDDGGATWNEVLANAPAGYHSGAAWTGSEYVVVGPTGSAYSSDGLRWHQIDAGSFDAVAYAQGSTWGSGEKGRIARLVTIH